MHRLIRPAAVGFTVFIALTIYAANVGANHPGMTLVRVLPYGDKLGHFVLWGLLTAIVNLAMPNRIVLVGRWPIPLGTVALVVVVMAEESSQRWLDNRTLDLADLVANLLGIGLATTVGLLYSRRRQPVLGVDSR